eukprot:scaffold57572_cov72-Phaeocystis_antarctica.AAC.1
MDAQGAEQVLAGPHALEPRRHRYRRKGDGGIRAAQVCGVAIFAAVAAAAALASTADHGVEVAGGA